MLHGGGGVGVYKMGGRLGGGPGSEAIGWDGVRVREWVGWGGARGGGCVGVLGGVGLV